MNHEHLRDCVDRWPMLMPSDSHTLLAEYDAVVAERDRLRLENVRSILNPLETPNSSPAQLDFTKPVRTREGKKVRILCTDGPGTQPIVGIIDGVDFVCQWFADGRYYEGTRECNDDLVQHPASGECWVNGYCNHYGEWITESHATLQGAKGSVFHGWHCCIRVKLVEGQFDA